MSEKISFIDNKFEAPKEIINNLREKKDEIEAGTKVGQGENFDTNYIKALRFARFSEEERVYMKEKLEGKIVVDFGSGNVFSVVCALDFLLQFNIGGYVGVDPNKSTSARHISRMSQGGNLTRNCHIKDGNLKEVIKFAENESKFIHLRSDFLTVAKELPNDCCCVLMNAIDHNITETMTKDYKEQVAKEMARIVPKNGIIFGEDGSRSEIETFSGGKNGEKISKFYATEPNK